MHFLLVAGQHARSSLERSSAPARRNAHSEHTAYVVLLDRAGRQRVGFPFDKLTPEGLAHDLRRLEQSDTPT